MELGRDGKTIVSLTAFVVIIITFKKNQKNTVIKENVMEKKMLKTLTFKSGVGGDNQPFTVFVESPPKYTNKLCKQGLEQILLS